MNQRNNILLNQIDGSCFVEVSPSFPDSQEFPLFLCLDENNNLYWEKYIKENSVEVHSTYFNPELFYKNGRIGVGREPLFSYKFDIAVSENQLSTGFHIGDGRYGFSMGNGTNSGFLPEIIGMGRNEEDSGLYIIGRAGNSLSSDIPLVIIDGRDSANEEIRNRPIFAITSANYRNYKFIVDQNGNVGIGKKPEIYKMEVDGKISAKDFIIRGISISDIIQEYQADIQELKNKLLILDSKIKNNG